MDKIIKELKGLSKITKLIMIGLIITITGWLYNDNIQLKRELDKKVTCTTRPSLLFETTYACTINKSDYERVYKQ